MSENNLGNFEEVILLVTGILGDQAYAFRIAAEVEIQTGRASSIGAVHSTLNRLENKGFLTSQFGKPTIERGDDGNEFIPLQLMDATYWLHPVILNYLFGNNILISLLIA